MRRRSEIFFKRALVRFFCFVHRNCLCMGDQASVIMTAGCAVFLDAAQAAVQITYLKRPIRDTTAAKAIFSCAWRGCQNLVAMRWDLKTTSSETLGATHKKRNG